MRVLVCGGRDADPNVVWHFLEHAAMAEIGERLSLHRRRGDRITCIIHGGARGADEGAGRWGDSENIPVRRYPADWKKHGKAAGPIRNRRMLEEGKPDIVIAFAGGRGTADMVRQAEAAGVPVVRVTPSLAQGASE